MSEGLLVSNLFSVKDKIALITGGGTGIGKMIALAKELTEMGPGKCFGIEADLNSKDACEKLVADFKNFGNDKLDILINNAGTWNAATVTNVPEDEWDRIYNLNVNCLPLLEKASKKPVDPSRVIIIGSICALGISSLLYSSSKSAVHSVSKNLAVHLTPRGVNVNVLAPGVIPTVPRGPGINDIAISEIPQGRLGDELDMAGAGLYLASRASSWVSGVELVVDGGDLLQYKLTNVQRLQTP
ncbi:hypothetical protein C2G38_2131138 [Gigaspora rosea]|uniref:NAD(P)-binding protein n=1 Tax=Gigaspora rosea TaxID=44941 RepID=A0A397W6N5_9GLOM|nr:hypothetical protein C2G38_2131138 [Gigaspora rosea]